MSLLTRTGAAAGLWLLLVGAAPGYRQVEPVPHVRLEVPVDWQEHRRESDVVYAPARVDYRSKSLGYGIRVFVEEGGAANLARRLDEEVAAYSKANPGLRTAGSVLIEAERNRASIDYTLAPPDDPTVRDAGWIIVARLPTRRWLCVIAVMPEAERARNADVFAYVRRSLQVDSQ